MSMRGQKVSLTSLPMINVIIVFNRSSSLSVPDQSSNPTDPSPTDGHAGGQMLSGTDDGWSSSSADGQNTSKV